MTELEVTQELPKLEKDKIANTKYLHNNEAVKENFYDAINKEWLDNNEIPDEYSRWGTFEILHKKTQENLKALLEKSDTDSKEGKLLHAYYNSYMNTEYRHIENIRPILPYLSQSYFIKHTVLRSLLIFFEKKAIKIDCTFDKNQNIENGIARIQQESEIAVRQGITQFNFK